MLFFRMSVRTHLSHHGSLTNGKIFTDRQQEINMFIFVVNNMKWECEKVHSSVQNVI